jgi:hypothetical protein
MATLAEIREAAKLKREKNLTPAQAVAEVRASSPVVQPPTINTPPIAPTPETQPEAKA